jgi:hypothetical protein
MASPKEKSAKTRGVQWFNLDADAWSHVINRLDILDVQNSCEPAKNGLK